jgi:hypothetical protein
VARSELGPRVAGDGRSGHGHGAPPAELYDHLLQVCLLLLLQETPAGCRELRDGLRPLGFEQTAVELQCMLGALEFDGLVACDGHVSAPAYALTGDGASWLHDAKSDLRRTVVVRGGFRARCSARFVRGA